MAVKNKSHELEWNKEDCAQPIGKSIKFTGKGNTKKCHYETFEFHDKKYDLENSVLCIPEDKTRKPYVAIIKDIYTQGKEGYVKIEVQWFYRPEDVEKQYVKDWEPNDSRDIFYSFHRDEVFAESVKHHCIVLFVPTNKQIPKRRNHPGFIAQYVYDPINKKLKKFSSKEFNKKQKQEIDLLMAKTISRVGDLPDVVKEKKIVKPRRKHSAPKRARRNVVDEAFYKSILENFNILTGDSDRDKGLEELLKAVEHKCRVSETCKAGDYDSLWPNDAVPVVRALEQLLYDSIATDIPKYNNKLEVIVDNLKNSRMLAERLLIGELKPEQIITMTSYELRAGHTFAEITAVNDHDASTSKSVRR